jgi:ABC-type glycerol-3-phosphate transport system permease component
LNPASVSRAGAVTIRAGRVSRAFGWFTVYATLVGGAILISIPFYWLVRTSLMNEGDHFLWPPILWPNPIVWQNYVDIFEMRAIPMTIFLRNSTILVVAATLGEVISTSVSAFAFARLRWYGRDVVFAMLIATMFLPAQVTIIPLFLIWRDAGLLNSLWPLIIPSWLGHALYIFLMRQFIMTIPTELDDAARIDGCGTFRIYASIIVPLCAPALGTIAIFSFQGKWNQFFEPLIYINKVDVLPLAVGVRMFRSALTSGGAASGNISWSHLLAATVVMVLPIILVFFLAQRAFIQGIVVSGVKG